MGIVLSAAPLIWNTAVGFVDLLGRLAWDNCETIEATAIVGVDLNAKGQQMPQRFGSASSYGKKYALGNLLLIDDTADADATNSHGRDTSVKSKVQNLQNKIVSSKKPLINKANIEQAKKFLSNGGLMKTLEDKYTITEEARTELVNE